MELTYDPKSEKLVVTEATRNYRENSDIYLQYIKEKIKPYLLISLYNIILCPYIS